MYVYPEEILHRKWDKFNNRIIVLPCSYLGSVATCLVRHATNSLIKRYAPNK